MKSLQFSTTFLLAALLGGATAFAEQTLEPSGSELANRAYQELAQKNYQAAIESFKGALRATPLNSGWRQDLGYAYVAAGLFHEAQSEFDTVYKDNPSELRLALELGYVSERLHEEASAERYFHVAAASPDVNVSKSAKSALENLESSRLWAQKQQAFDFLAANRREDATRLFEAVHSADPADADASLQLGYIYLAKGDARKARQAFESQTANQNSDVADRAAAGLEEVKRESKRWFSDIYAASFYQSRFSNEINQLNAKSGVRAASYFQPYMGVRISRDTRSTAGAAPVVFSDNSLILALGVQSPIRRSGARIYAEAGAAFDTLSHTTWKHSTPDYRGGVNWSGQWGVSMAQAAQSHASHFSLTGAGYSDVSYYRRYNRNVIGYAQLRQGVNLPTARIIPMQILLGLNVVKDSRKNFYNNIVEVAPVIRIAPIRSLPEIQLEAQYVRGYYSFQGRNNPYQSRYDDVRFALIWGGSFGR